MQTQDPHRSKLPQQLQNPSLRFVKLLPKSKKPYEKDWTRKPYKSDEIECWFSEGNNYGILGGHGGLIIVDADTPEIVSLLDKLPPTARQKTPKK